MTNAHTHPFPPGRVLGNVDLRNGKLTYEVRSSFKDAGPILDTLRRILANLEADTLPGDVERVSVDRFEVARDGHGKSVYAFDVEIEWSVEAGKIDENLRRRLCGGAPWGNLE